MPDWIAVGNEDLLADGGTTEVEVDGTRVLLARVEGSYYAVQAFCSHLGGDLGRGRIEGFVVSCPRNVSRFDLRDGSVVAWLSRLPGVVRKVGETIMPPKCLRTYPTRVGDGQVWIQTTVGS